MRQEAPDYEVSSVNMSRFPRCCGLARMNTAKTKVAHTISTAQRVKTSRTSVVPFPRMAKCVRLWMVVVELGISNTGGEGLCLEPALEFEEKFDNMGSEKDGTPKDRS